MGFLTRLTARVFGPKDTTPFLQKAAQNQQRVFTVPEAVAILETYSKTMPRVKYNEFRAAARFLYEERALPKSFLRLPYKTQEEIVCGPEKEGIVAAVGISLLCLIFNLRRADNVNRYIPNNGVLPTKAPTAPPPPPRRD